MKCNPKNRNKLKYIQNTNIRQGSGDELRWSLLDINTFRSWSNVQHINVKLCTCHHLSKLITFFVVIISNPPPPSTTFLKRSWLNIYVDCSGESSKNGATPLVYMLHVQSSWAGIFSRKWELWNHFLNRFHIFPILIFSNDSRIAAHFTSILFE